MKHPKLARSVETRIRNEKRRKKTLRLKKTKIKEAYCNSCKSDCEFELDIENEPFCTTCGSRQLTFPGDEDVISESDLLQ